MKYNSEKMLCLLWLMQLSICSLGSYDMETTYNLLTSCHIVHKLVLHVTLLKLSILLMCCSQHIIYRTNPLKYFSAKVFQLRGCDSFGVYKCILFQKLCFKISQRFSRNLLSLKTNTRELRHPFPLKSKCFVLMDLLQFGHLIKCHIFEPFKCG